MPLLYTSFFGASGGGQQASDPLFSNVILLLGFEGEDEATSTTDESEDERTVTFNGGAQIDTAQKKFGASSLFCDGSGDYISVPHDSAFSVDSGDFCWEMFFRLNELGRVHRFTAKRDALGAEEFIMGATPSNEVVFGMFSGGASVVFLTGPVVTSGQWYHIAASREGSTCRLFLDGNLEVTDTQSGAPEANNAPVLFGRSAFDPSRDLHGWLDEVRMTKGAARYTSSFTPPAEAFPRQ